MTHEIYFLIVGLIPIFLIFIFGVNAIYLFFSLLIGYLLTNLLPGNVNRLVNLLSNTQIIHVSRTYNSRLVILYLPVLLTFFFMIKSVKGHKRFINLIPSICFSILAIFLTLPFIKTSDLRNITDNSLFNQLIINKSLIIVLISLIILFFIFFERFKSKKSKKHH